VGTNFDTINKINNLLGYVCAILTGGGLFIYVTKYSIKSIKEQGLGQGALLSTIFILENILGTSLFLGLAWFLPTKIPFITFSLVLWIEIYIISLVYFSKRKYAEQRGLRSALLHLIVLSLGWITGQWLGMLFFSAPILFVYYYIIYRIALVIVPASNLENKKEKHQRRMVFLSYAWGLQMPLWNVKAVSTREIDKQLDGAPFLNLFPGMLWTYSHQVVGISNGINFRVEGPGVVFTQKGDQPFEIIDLRNQSRKSTIRAFSRDGIPFLATVNATFAIDREEWNPTLFHQLTRKSTMLIKRRDLDQNLKGLFPYSNARVKAALYLRSKISQPDGEIEYWDDHVLAIAEETAREVLSERNLNELWLEHENENSSALDEIATRMKTIAETPLREKGVRLISIKVVPDFSDSEKEQLTKEEQETKDKEVKEKVVKQQIATWSVDRERERSLTRSSNEIEAERIEQEARVYAHSALLTAIAEGLQLARARHPNLPRYIIALRYIGALESMINQQPYNSEDEEQGKARASIYNAKKRLLFNPPKE